MLPEETLEATIIRIRSFIADLQHARDRVLDDAGAEQLLRDYNSTLGHLETYLKSLEARAAR